MLFIALVFAIIDLAIIGETKLKILRTLARQQTHGYALAAEVGIPVTAIYQHLRELERDGLVRREVSGPRKLLVLTPKGERLLEVVDMDDEMKK